LKIELNCVCSGVRRAIDIWQWLQNRQDGSVIFRLWNRQQYSMVYDAYNTL